MMMGYPRRPGGDGAGDRDGGGQHADRGKMILGQPPRVDAAGLCFIHQRKALGKGLLFRHPLTAWELDEESKVHARLLSCSVRHAARSPDPSLRLGKHPY
jgi:hypothetical protein